MQVNIHRVFDGVKGWSHGGITYRLAVGGNLAQAADGTLLCVWLSGTGHEPATDNCVLIARSADGGKRWSEPSVFVPAGIDAGAGTVMPWPLPNGQMAALCARWPSEHQYTIWKYFRMHSQDHGQTWEDDGPFALAPLHNASHMPPIRCQNGRILLPVSTYDKRDMPFVGSVDALVRAKTEEEALAIPARAEGEKDGEKFSTHLHGCCVYECDENFTRFTRLGAVANRPLGLLEPALTELADGRLVLLMRAEFDGFLWQSESADGGKTFCPAWRTEIPNPSSMVNLTRLPDGRTALLHNPSGGVLGQKARRNPLSLWISDDGMETWSIKEDLITTGTLSYPNAILRNDSTLVFGYDHNRNEVRFVEVVL